MISPAASKLIFFSRRSAARPGVFITYKYNIHKEHIKHIIPKMTDISIVEFCDKVEFMSVLVADVTFPFALAAVGAFVVTIGRTLICVVGPNVSGAGALLDIEGMMVGDDVSVGSEEGDVV